jgi:SAM-dependent methyltransferase
MTKAPAPRTRFDAAYYRRFYRDPATRVHHAPGQGRLAALVFAWMDYLELPVRRVLDMGCGLGHWRRELRKRHPSARYTGVEGSDYLCAAHGWEKGSADTWRGRGRYDLVVCQSVLQYLEDAPARAAVANLARHCRGLLYLEALTRGDWDRYCNKQVTDGRVRLRTAAWYRKEVSRHFRALGGGLYLPWDSPAILYELETP